MYYRSLYLAVALALSAPVAASPAITSVPASRQAVALPLHDQAGTMTLSKLPDFFRGGSSSAVARLAAQAGLRQSLSTQLATLAADDPLIGWVSADALVDEQVAERIATMYSVGIPVLIIAPAPTAETEQRIEAIVGPRSNATIAIYHRGDEHKSRIFSIDAPGNVTVDVSKALRRAAHSLQAYLAEDTANKAGGVQTTALSRNTASDGAHAALAKVDANNANGVQAIALPIYTVSDDAYAADGSGASVIQQVDILRDSSTTRDQYVISAKATYNLIPSNNGHVRFGLTLPERYRVTQRLTIDSEGTPGITPTLQRQYPASTGSTAVTFSETQSTTTSYGFNISTEVSAGLQGPVPEASAKTAYGFTFGRTYVDEKNFNFTINDYNVATGATAPSPVSRESSWDYRLATAIRSNAGYFGNPPNGGRFTPMMERATVQAYSRWVVPGRHRGGFTINAGAPPIDNVSYTGSAVNQSRDARRQPTSVISVPSRLPFLSRETTVMIQSQLGSGGCLFDSSGIVRLTTCPTPNQPGYLNTYVAQWQLDAESRYVNRGTGRCLEVDLVGGGTTTQPCSFKLEQRWQWRADRLHSLYDDATANWRLHMVNGQVRSRTDLAVYQDLPLNPNHALLNPWSNYPSAPVRGVTIPTYDGNPRPAPIPDAWLQFKAVTSDQVWRVIPLRANI
jgi:hemolysin